MVFRVEKRGGRLWITRLGDVVYTPPDFIRLASRAPMQRLADELNAGVGYIEAVMRLEHDAPRVRS